MSEEIFSSRLTRFRESRGLTKEHVGRSLGVSARYVAMMESGDKDVDPNSSLYKLFCLMEANQVPLTFEPDRARNHARRDSRLSEPRAEYKVGTRPGGSGLTEQDMLAQVQADLEMIATGSPAERRRSFIFLRDHHLPLLAQTFHIDL